MSSGVETLEIQYDMYFVTYIQKLGYVKYMVYLLLYMHLKTYIIKCVNIVTRKYIQRGFLNTITSSYSLDIYVIINYRRYILYNGGIPGCR
jgi:hypothetical protein